MLADDNKPEEQFIPLVETTIGKNVRMKLVPISMRNGGVYEGEWKNGKRDGHGKYVWPDKSFYEGEWVEDKANGKGKLGLLWNLYPSSC